MSDIHELIGSDGELAVPDYAPRKKKKRGLPSSLPLWVVLLVVALIAGVAASAVVLLFAEGEEQSSAQISAVDVDEAVGRGIAGQWTTVGAANGRGGIAAAGTEARNPALTITLNGQPYVAWVNWTEGGHYQVYVKRYDAANDVWEAAGQGAADGDGISAAAGSVTAPAISAAPDGTIYAAWLETAETGVLVRARHFRDGAWHDAGGGVVWHSAATRHSHAYSEKYVALRVGPQDGIPYLAWQAENDGIAQIYVMRLNGDTWEEVGAGTASGGGLSATATDSTQPSLDVTPNNYVYVAWETSPETGNSEIYAKRYVYDWGETVGHWEEIGAWSANGGGISLTSTRSTDPYVVVQKVENPFVVWVEGTRFNGMPDDEIFGKVYSIDRWDDEGMASASMRGISNMEGKSFQPVVAASWRDATCLAWTQSGIGSMSRVYVTCYGPAFGFDGWQPAGLVSQNAGFVSNLYGDIAQNPAMAFEPQPGDGLYVAWEEHGSDGSDIWVRRFAYGW